MLQKLKKLFLLSAVIIVGLSFSLSCENPLSPNLGRKVDVVPPAVIVRSPSAGGFIRGVALFEGRATAYRSLKRVEYKIFANDATGQALVDWREVHYVNTNNSKERNWYLDLDTSQLNRGNDGSIKMQFRAIDDSQKGETVEFVYIVKNRPSVISMTTPAEDLKNPNTTPKLVSGTDIRGNITDRKGLKPGFPQIKIWPDELGYEPDPNDNYRFNNPSDVNWGWASLFLPGIGDGVYDKDGAPVGKDDLEGIPPGGWLVQGSYADRTKMSPVRVAQFAFRLDKFIVVVDDDNPDIRQVVYETDGNGNRVHMEPGKLYHFRIRTSDTNTYEDEKELDTYQLPIRYVTQKQLDDVNKGLEEDPGNKELIKERDRLIEDQRLFSDNLIGHFPPVNYGETSENSFRKRPEAVRLSIISDAVPPEIVLDNADVSSQAGWNKKPHIYIDEPTVKKIAAEDPVNPNRDLFRLRIKGLHPDAIARATLKYTHDATGREGYLKWDADPNAQNEGYLSTETELERAKQGHRGVHIEPLDPAKGTIFTFTATPANQKDIETGEPIFLTSSGPYILEATVWSGSNSENTAKYVVYVDGDSPDVSVQEIVGASSEVEQIGATEQAVFDGLARAAGGVINGSPYTVNNNIQVVLTRPADDSGIMQNIDPNSPNPNDPNPITPAPWPPATPPGRSKAELIDLDMVKWVVEEDTGADYFTKPGTTYQKLLTYKKNPTSANLEFFNTITDATTSPAMSGWVNPPKTAGKPADMRNNFKFNTRSFDGKDLWVYVIAQDTVQNLGFVIQKIKVDQSSDIPKLAVEALFDKNAADVNITGSNDLNVTVNNNHPNPTMTGNIKQGFRNNVLEENQGIDLNFSDYDGINLASGISIRIFDLNGQGPNNTNLSGTLTAAEIAEVLKDGNKNSWNGVLSQQIMATALYRSLPPAQQPNPMHLYDGMYRVEITYSDDVNEKVAITLADRPGMTTLQDGDTPVSVSGNPSPKIYWFAVNAEADRPQITVDSVAENQMQGDLPVTVYGSVRSRLKVQRLWISFTPDIITEPPGAYNTTHTEEITTLYTTAAHTTAIQQANWLAYEGKDAAGYYIYYWKKDGVIFQPPGNNYGKDQDNRRVSLEAYDRLGNKNTYTRTVLVDTNPPDVNVIFNYGRTAGVADEDYNVIGGVNGKVPFTIIATDNNKLMEYPSDRPNDPYAAVKWWVLPVGVDVTNFAWGTAFPSGTGGAGGWFYSSQEGNGGRFTAVINTTTLTNFSDYKLYVMARDTAGNTTSQLSVRLFHVDQDTDYPTLDTANLSPPLGAVMGSVGINISGGLAGDDDGFDWTKLAAITDPVVGGTGYVQIRFPATWNTNTGVPLTWGQWISVPGSRNPDGKIKFDFRVDNLAGGSTNTVFNGYLSFEGAKHYQVRVTDEAVAGANNNPPGKNPDNAAPFLPSVSRIFPVPGGLTDTYYFVMDTKPPEIFFAKYDPNKDHPNYDSQRPAYASFDLLLADLRGYVEENNLDTFTLIWDTIRERYVKDVNLIGTNTNGVITHTWDINGLTTATKDALREKFNSVREGLHSIVLEATDTALNRTRTEWMFNKDTQGPEISVNSIRRKIDHPSIPAATIPPFPANWPSDWPFGPNWKADTTWTSFRTSFGADNWASEYAYYTGDDVPAKAVKVIKTLTDEHERAVPVISGEPDDVSIRGTFTDALSVIRTDTNNPSFYYRFHAKGDTGNIGRNLTVPPSNTAGWEAKAFEPLTGGRYNSADWVIPLTTAWGFNYADDGEYTFDIKVADIAGNWAELYGLRFIIDRKNPLLLGYTANGNAPEGVPLPPAKPDVPHSFKVESDGVAKPLAVNERVFSANSASASSPAPVFLLKGLVRDENLSELFVVITTEGGAAVPYRVESTLAITDSTISTTPSDDHINGSSTADGFSRLSAARTANAHEWEWTLSVPEKDVYALRQQGNDGTRRYITVTATDKAKRRDGPHRWDFYLDSIKPVIEYTNLAKGPNFTVNSSTNVNDITLQGIATDDTKIKNIQYSIAKWNYELSIWQWYTGTRLTGSWTLNTQPPTADWASMNDTGYGPATASSMVNWKLDRDKLNASDKYPTDLFAIQGQYKIDLYVTDYSIAYGGSTAGNPHNTALNTADPPYSDTGYDPVANTGNASARKFFVDRADPEIVWKEADITYYRTGTFTFKFTASDFNTILPPIEARIKRTDGSYIDIDENLITITPPNGIWDLGKQCWVYDVEVKPNPASLFTTPQETKFGNFTLEITARDAAGREANESKPFTFDDVPPTMAIVNPPGKEEAVTGRVVIRGNTEENSNQIKRVAFYIPEDAEDTALPDVPPIPNGKEYTGDPVEDARRGWRFNNGMPGDPWSITGGQTYLIGIEPGTFTWEIKIPNTRHFATTPGSKYIQWAKAGDTGATGLTYEGKAIPPGEDVGKLTMYIIAEDEAGNTTTEPPKYFWLYPEGDRPVVTKISNPDDAKIEAERLMNGRIRVAGMARDNERIKYVYFRVLNKSTLVPYELTVYSWNSETWEVATDAELASGSDKIINNTRPRPLTNERGDPLGDGWYIANGGGSANVSWYTYINMEGELEPEPGTTGANEVIIEVRAEDTTRDDYDEWAAPSVKGMVSRDKGDPTATPPRPTPSTNIGNTVTALVVRGAPIFENEQIWTGKSTDTSPPPKWGDISAYSLSGRASYRITVKDDSGIGAVRWTPKGGSSINLLDPANVYNTGPATTNGTYAQHLANMDTITTWSATTNPGIAAKAEPKPERLKTSGTQPAGTYLIWEPGTGYATYLLPQGAIANVRYTTFTATASFTLSGTGAQLIEQTDDGYFEWVVVVDVNTKILENGIYNWALTNNEDSLDSYLYPLNLTATEISKATPLTTSRTSYLPLDNRPPKGSYTINTRPAGQAATIGGEAGDTGPVSGISKVVIWFSRDKAEDGTQTDVSWHEQGVMNVHGEEIDDTKNPPAPPSGWKLNRVSDFQYDPTRITVTRIGTDGKPFQDNNFRMPLIPAETVGTGGSYAIVIDRNDPSGVSTHHGHNLPMGLSTGGMGKIWYVELNSFGLVSGPIYIHYVVYDTANNASYFKERLVVMNNAPRIDRIKLGTDIRNNSTLQSGTNEGQKTGNLPASGGGTTVLDRIRNAVPLGTTDVQKGITDYISAIRTAETGAIRSIDFNARNRLLAFRVETTGKPGDLKYRTFKFEYVSGAKNLNNSNPATADKLTAITAGRVYVIEDPGNARWGAVGAPDASAYTRGFAFMASLDAKDGETGLYRGGLDTATGSVWELNSSGTVPTNLAIGDAYYPIGENNIADSAEFAYRGSAFGTNRGSTIVDFTPNSTSNNPAEANCLFVLKIFDGPETDVFADFAIFSLRVNNNDVTRPSSQLYDLNPLTEGQARQQSVQRSLAPMGIGLNRTRGGLWNTDTTARTVAKPGHIEPRRATSLTSAQMGGADTLAGSTVAVPYANPLAFFTTDTVSGRVVLRGYAEDDQRIQRIDLIFSDVTGNVATQTVQILEAVTNTTGTGGAGTPAQYLPPTTGLVSVPAAQAGRVYYTDDIDLYRHRIEWAYIWDTETTPANLIVGNARVRAVVSNANSAGYDPASAVKASADTAAPTTGQAGTLNNYNSIPVNIRPYITGLMRDQSRFFHNTRSRQGWYAFSRSTTTADGEVVVARGYNMGRANLTTNISLPSAANLAAAAATAAQATSHGLPAPNEVFRYRAFQVTQGATPGLITLTAGTYPAVNNYTNGNDRPRLNAAGTAVDNNGRFWVQPWNKENSPGTTGSDLWDDFTSVHIWQSTDVTNATNNADQGAFPLRKTNSTYMNPAMSMDPGNGALYASHNEGGAGTVGANSGTTMISNNYSSWATSGSGNQVVRAAVTTYASFVDPIMYSDIYFPPTTNATPAPAATANETAFSSYSIIGRSGNYELWGTLGGVYVSGPGGTNAHLSNGMNQNNQYHAESTYYNASSNSATVAAPPTTDQFSNTHIVTSGNNIHVSYYDTKDGSVKYRYNLRGSQNDTLNNNNPANISARDTGSAGVNGVHNQNAQAISKQWTNLDGGYDTDDTAATNFVNDNVRNLAGAGSTAIAANARVVNQGTRPAAAANRIDAGEHNSIALTSQGYPVVAYFDTTNQKLKLAVSRRVAPVLAADWRIRDNVIPTANLSHYATGEFVSIAIDTAAGANQNRIHMAALNSTSKNLVYITGIVNPTSDGDGLLTGVTVQVVDNVGSVGRWCDISLDDTGNPWIAYQDESYRGSMDGVRTAFLNRTTYTKAMLDAYGESIAGWESMNVPARYRVDDARINIENFPARNFPRANNNTVRFWQAAVAYPSPDFFRIVYYVR